MLLLLLLHMSLCCSSYTCHAVIVSLPLVKLLLSAKLLTKCCCDSDTWHVAVSYMLEMLLLSVTYWHDTVIHASDMLLVSVYMLDMLLFSVILFPCCHCQSCPFLLFEVIDRSLASMSTAADQGLGICQLINASQSSSAYSFCFDLPCVFTTRLLYNSRSLPWLLKSLNPLAIQRPNS